MEVHGVVEHFIVRSEQAGDKSKPLLPLAAPDQVKTFRYRDPVDPGAETAVAFELIDGTVHLDEHFLRHVLRIGSIMHHAQGRVVHHILAAFHQLFKRKLISIAELLYQILFCQSNGRLEFEKRLQLTKSF